MILVCLLLGWLLSVITSVYFAIQANKGHDVVPAYICLIIMWLFILAINIYNLFNILQ